MGNRWRGLDRWAAAAAALAAAFVWPASTEAASKKPPEDSFVYVMTNRASGNSIIQYRRDQHGRLTPVREEETGGLGSGGELDSQGALTLSRYGRHLFAVNAGSDDVSVLGIGSGGVQLLSRVPSGGDFPTSVASFGDLLYVLNARGTPNITGFRVPLKGGALLPIPGSTRALPAGAAGAPADIHFTPDGRHLLVTEKGAYQIDVFAVGPDGRTGDPVIHPAAGNFPFGLVIRDDGTVLVAEELSASVSSYALDEEGNLELVSAHVSNGQARTKWISLTRAGNMAFVSNTEAGTLSSYALTPRGAIVLRREVAASLAGGSPADIAISMDGKNLYVLDPENGRIVGCRINGPRLTEIDTVTGLPPSIQGLVAR
jgi:6-phosphogluconolactonase (cycloisomerase 2 family)